MVGYEYKECGNMRYFGNPIVVSDYLFCNVLYYIVKIFPLIYIYEHNWSNYIKTSFIVYVKAFIVQQIGIRAFIGITHLNLP